MLLLKPISPEARLNDKTPYLPVAQSKHVLSEEAPIAAEYFPAAQSKQLLAPGAAEYLPAVQSVHVAPTLHAAVKPERVPD